MYSILEALRAEGLPEEDCTRLAALIGNFQASCSQIPQQITDTENYRFSTQANVILEDTVNNSTQELTTTSKGTKTTAQRSEKSEITNGKATSDKMSDYNERRQRFEKNLRNLSDQFVERVIETVSFDENDTRQEIEVKLVAMERLHDWLGRLFDTLIDAIKKAFQWMIDKIANVATKVKTLFSNLFKSLFSGN